MDHTTMAKQRSGSLTAYRVGAAVVALIGLAVLLAAAYVKPSPAGVGSHRQLGLHACGFYERTGYPCPTCGMTTAFAYTVRGRLGRALATQPAGALGALGCIVITAIAGWGAVTGKRFENYSMWLLFHWRGVLICAIAVVLLSWLWLCLVTWMRAQ